jgi:DNA-binding NarL/FixJ family response regulator
MARKGNRVSIRVLLVEDFRQMHGVLADLLESIGDFKVVAALRTEAEAKLWLRENWRGWDLAVIDLILEEGTGLGVIEPAATQAAKTGSRVVVFSDYISPGIREHCAKLGAHAVFQKTHQTGDFMRYCAEIGGIQLEGK